MIGLWAAACIELGGTGTVGKAQRIRKATPEPCLEVVPISFSCSGGTIPWPARPEAALLFNFSHSFCDLEVDFVCRKLFACSRCWKGRRVAWFFPLPAFVPSCVRGHPEVCAVFLSSSSFLKYCIELMAFNIFISCNPCSWGLNCPTLGWWKPCKPPVQSRLAAWMITCSHHSYKLPWLQCWPETPSVFGKISLKLFDFGVMEAPKSPSLAKWLLHGIRLQFWNAAISHRLASSPWDAALSPQGLVRACGRRLVCRSGSKSSPLWPGSPMGWSGQQAVVTPAG